MGYVDAITAAVEVANVAGKGIKYLIEHADDIKSSIDSLASMLRSAKKLYNTAEDVVDPLVKAMAVETDEAINAAESAGSIEDKVGQPVQRGQGRAAGILKGAADKVAVFADERKSDIDRWRLERELRKTVHDAKRTVLDGANIKIPLAKLVEQLNSEDDAIRLANLGVLDSSGCFAIATYGKLDRGGDPTDYRGIFVGKAECVGDGIAQTIVSSGNADVYADIKYKQNVWVYVFTSVPEKLDEKYEALVELLEARDSYNGKQEVE